MSRPVIYQKTFLGSQSVQCVCCCWEQFSLKLANFLLAAGRDGKALGPVSDNFLGDANFGSFYANSRYFTLIFGVFTQNQNLFTLLIGFTHFLVLIFPLVKSVMVPIFKFFISGVKWSCCWSCCSLVDRAVLEIAPPIPVVIYIQWFYAVCVAKLKLCPLMTT